MNFEEAYARELEERDRVRSHTGISVGVITVLGGLLGTMWQAAPLSSGGLFAAFGVSVAISGAAFVVAFVFLVLSGYGHVYHAVPTPLEYRNYRDAKRAWCQRNGKDLAAADTALQDFMEECYATTTHANAHVNWKRNDWLYRFNVAATVCAVFGLIAFVPFSIAARGAIKVEQVEIVNWSEGVETMSEDAPTTPPPAAPAAPATPPAPATAPPAPDPEPQPPPIHQFRGGQETSIPLEAIILTKE